MSASVKPISKANHDLSGKFVFHVGLFQYLYKYYLFHENLYLRNFFSK